MKTKYLSPLVCKVITEMLLNREVKGDIMLKDGTTVPNGFIDYKDGSDKPFKTESNDYWYTRNLRYIHCNLEKPERAIIGFENTKDIDELEHRVHLIDSSFCLYEFNRKAKLIDICWSKPEMYTKDYRFNKKARVLIGQLAKEGKLKGDIIIANGKTLVTSWREDDGRINIGGWWYLLKMVDGRLFSRIVELTTSLLGSQIQKT